jgi:hypothetical protein
MTISQIYGSIASILSIFASAAVHDRQRFVAASETRSVKIWINLTGFERL